MRFRFIRCRRRFDQAQADAIAVQSGKAKLLPENFAVMGVSVDDLSVEDFRSQVTSFCRPDDSAEALEWLRKRLFYERGDFARSQYVHEASRAAGRDRRGATHQGNYLFYLATAPKFFAQIVQQLGNSGLSRQENGRWRRVVIEKPFGHDLDSAKALNRDIKRVLQENQIFRIDHYLGKETVQNIMVFRFDNAIFEPIWNRRYIDHVQITNAETVGVELRGGIFRYGGNFARYGPEPRDATAQLDRHGVSRIFSGGRRAQRAGQSFAFDSALDSEDVLQRTVRGQYGEGTIAARKSTRLS